MRSRREGERGETKAAVRMETKADMREGAFSMKAVEEVAVMDFPSQITCETGYKTLLAFIRKPALDKSERAYSVQKVRKGGSGWKRSRSSM